MVPTVFVMIELDEGNELFLKKKFQESIEKYEIVLEQEPNNLIALNNKGYSLSKLKKYSEAFYRCYPDRPSNTVKENHGGVFVHYEKNRVMTPRELARLQSFPDDFVFKGTKSSMLIQLGNAVPCGLSNALASASNSVASSGPAQAMGAYFATP